MLMPLARCVICAIALTAVFLAIVPPLNAAEEHPNLLLITVDDMSCDSVGAFGCPLPTTPNIDRLAESGLRYAHAHVQTGSCFPSRNVLLSGRYSHNTGVEGFYQVPNATYPHFVDLMQSAGYFVGIFGKVSHSTPYSPYGWDVDLTSGDEGKLHIKNPESYETSTRRGIALAKQAGKPFCLNINVSDPHKPFYGTTNNNTATDDPFVPTAVFSPSEVPIPAFLFDDPDIRLELARYYASVRRADDCVGRILSVLQEANLDENTIVVFLSDHGMPLPFAKTGVWFHSTHTPLIVRWPGKTKAGSVDQDHMVSAVDLLPTLLEGLGLACPQDLDGRSFLPTITGQPQANRDVVYTFHNENSGRNRSPMRSVQTKQFGYIFNPWSDGQRVFRTATTGTLSYRTMQRRAASDSAIAARLDLFEHRVPEELYDYEHDPAALHNLIDDPAYADVLKELREEMQRIMETSHDPLLELFQRRKDAAFVSAEIDALQAEADARGGKRKNAPQANRQSQGKKPPQNQQLRQNK